MKLKSGTALIKIIFLILSAIALIYLLQPKSSFDESILNTDKIYQHISIISSEEYRGSMTGSEGNKKALEYIEEYFRGIGVYPAGVNDTYFQPFTALVPNIDTEPKFSIISDNGEILTNLIMYEDYVVLTSMNGGSIDFKGDIIFVGSDLLRIDPDSIKGRVVIIEANRLTPKHVNYVMQAGGKGVICSAGVNIYEQNRRFEVEKTLSISGKTGESIMAGYISIEAHRDLLKLAERDATEGNEKSFQILNGAEINVKIGFPIVDTANILGKIEGRANDGSVLLITANIDGTGAGTGDNYFPGALNSVSGLAVLLEMANVISNQDYLPYETIIFAGWNGQYQELSGSGYYIDNPLFPLDKTTVIHLEAIGKRSLEGLKISSDMLNGVILKDRIINYAKDEELKVVEGSQGYSPINQFNDKKVPAVLFYDSKDIQNSYDDKLDIIDKGSLENSSMVLLNFIKRDVFKDTRIDYLYTFEKAIIVLAFLGAILNYVINLAYNKNPNKKLLGHNVENIYYSGPGILLRKLYATLLSVIIAILILSILANIDPGTDVRIINREFNTNTSLYLIIKKSILYIRTMLNPSSYKVYAAGSILEIIYNSSRLSIILISSSLALSTIVGILRGMYEGYKSRKAKINSIGALIFFSVPDVLIVLLALMGYAFAARRFPAIKDITEIRGFILPLFTLSIIPTVYISRITFVTIQEELGKEYIKNAIAKGFSRRKVIFYELIPAVMFKVVDSMPAIMTMLLTNMIVVEWLFFYQGILYYLLYFYNRQDVYSFVPLAMTLGLMYMVFTWGIQRLARIINPLKNKGVQG